MTTVQEARAAVVAAEALVRRGDYREALACLAAAEPVLAAALGEAHAAVVEVRLDQQTIREMAAMHAFGRAWTEEVGVTSSTDVWEGPKPPR
jgi:hypothetical protein